MNMEMTKVDFLWKCSSHIFVETNFALFSDNDTRGFHKVDHSGINATIVLEQIHSAKNKLPLTGLEPSTLELSVLLTSCLSCFTPVLDPIA